MHGGHTVRPLNTLHTHPHRCHTTSAQPGGHHASAVRCRAECSRCEHVRGRRRLQKRPPPRVRPTRSACRVARRASPHARTLGVADCPHSGRTRCPTMHNHTPPALVGAPPGALPSVHGGAEGRHDAMRSMHRIEPADRNAPSHQQGPSVRPPIARTRHRTGIPPITARTPMWRDEHPQPAGCAHLRWWPRTHRTGTRQRADSVDAPAGLHGCHLDAMLVRPPMAQARCVTGSMRQRRHSCVGHTDTAPHADADDAADDGLPFRGRTRHSAVPQSDTATTPTTRGIAFPLAAATDTAIGAVDGAHPDAPHHRRHRLYPARRARQSGRASTIGAPAFVCPTVGEWDQRRRL